MTHEWHTRGYGSLEYYADATGKVLGEIRYSLTRGAHTAWVGLVQIGVYVTADAARAAIEAKVAEPPQDHMEMQ